MPCVILFRKWHLLTHVFSLDYQFVMKYVLGHSYACSKYTCASFSLNCEPLSFMVEWPKIGPQCCALIHSHGQRAVLPDLGMVLENS